METETSRTIKFSILLTCQVLSVSCSLFLLFHLCTKSTLRRPLHNHTIIALLIVSFFQTVSDLPMTLNYLRTGYGSSSNFCLMWNFFAFSNYAVGVWLMTWASAERHLLIFHDHLVVTFRGKIIFHYIPLVFFLAVPWFYYVFLVFFYPCTNTFYPSYLFCAWCCYAYNNQVVFFNWLTFGVIPTFSITLFSAGLILRVIIQKRRARQQMNWRRHRRMIIQLLGISALYIFFDAPTVIIGLVQLRWPTFAGEFQILYLFYIGYFLSLLMPFICLSTFHDLWPKRRSTIHPQNFLTQIRLSRRDQTVKTGNQQQTTNNL